MVQATFQAGYIGEDGLRPEILEKVLAMPTGFAFSKRDAEKGNPGRSRRQGVVDAISYINGGPGITLFENADQALRVRLRARDILDRNDTLEEAPDATPLEGVIKFLSRAAGKDGQLRAPGEALQMLAGQQPFFARHITRAVAAPIQLHELALHFFIFDFSAERLYPRRRKIPIVVETRLIFPVLELSAGHVFAGKELHGFESGTVKGAAHVHQYAVDIEDDDFRM